MQHAAKMPVWWDRDIDQTGRPIRKDVRVAGRETWGVAYRRTRTLLNDPGPAAELMETSVAEVSRYLDRIGAPQSSHKHGLVMAAFSRRLRRYATKLNRLEFVGGSAELSSHPVAGDWVNEVNSRLEIEGIVRKLRADNAAVLMLRAAGFDWKDVAQLMGKSPAAVRNSFWREVERIRSDSTVRRRQG